MLDKGNPINDLLRSTNRDGMDNLIGYLELNHFFTCVASARGHGSVLGGLADHSLNVYTKLSEFNMSLGLEVPESSLIIAALLHDVCKLNAYVRTKKNDGWTSNRKKEKGHALLSLYRIKKFIELTELEEMMIKFHMGVYGLSEFDAKTGEYELRNKQMCNAWFHHPIVKVMYFCDELSALEGR